MPIAMANAGNLFNSTFSRHCFFVNIVDLNYGYWARNFFGKNGLCVKVCTKPNIINPTQNKGQYLTADDIVHLYKKIGEAHLVQRTRTGSQRKVEHQVKVLIKNLAIFFLCPSKQFLPISFQIMLLEYFPEKQKEQRHTELGYTDKMVTTQIQMLKNSRSTLQL